MNMQGLADFKAGKMVIVVDNDDRENEGDLCIAAEAITPEAINFMAQYARGLICLTLTGERLDELQIPLMVAPEANGTGYQTAFTVSIEARQGVTTGISAADRATTILTAINPQSQPQDLVRPGHIFPLRARPGGVLERPGHTEAGIDLARLCGLYPAAVICEIMNPDGTMARRPELEKFAQQHNLSIITIADLIRYRQTTETLPASVASLVLTTPKKTASPTVQIQQVAQTRLPTAGGLFEARVFQDETGKTEIVALLSPAFNPQTNPLVRLHSECLTGDVFGSLRCDCGPQLQQAMRLIAADGNGLVLYLPQEGRGIGLANKIRAYALQEQGYDTVEANRRLGYPDDLREYQSAAAVLRVLGISRLRLLTNNPQKVSELAKAGLEVSRQIGLEIPPNAENLDYLRTKREKMGHTLSGVLHFAC